MKQTIILLAALFFCSVSVAQETAAQAPKADFHAIQPASLPPYAYCEIICGHLPSYKGSGAIIDFGQPVEALHYNLLRTDQDKKIRFNSSIEALNYMVSRGWEFVQAYTSGADNDNNYTHMLLRIATTQLSEAQKAALMTEPRARGEE